LWVNLKGKYGGVSAYKPQLLITLIFEALKRVLRNGEMKLDIIYNPKLLEDGRSVIQVIRISFLCLRDSKIPPSLKQPRVLL